MSGTISQMQMVYIAEEDRILFRVNSTDQQEFRFWLTRRYANLLVGILRNHADADPDISAQESPEAKQAVKSFKQEKAISEADFDKPFSADSNDTPLGQDVLLAFKLTYNIQGENLHIGVEPKEGRGINMVINRQINSSLLKLLLNAAEKGEWYLGQTAGRIRTSQEKHVIN